MADVAQKDYIDNPLAVDEEHESRRQILQVLALEPRVRLFALTGAYSLYVIGQRRLGRPVLGEDI